MSNYNTTMTMDETRRMIDELNAKDRELRERADKIIKEAYVHSFKIFLMDTYKDDAIARMSTWARLPIKVPPPY